jgi:ribose-phosphate pyrophosphokinase
LGVVAFADEAAAAGRLAEALGSPLQLVSEHQFPDGETMPRVQIPPPDTAILYRSLDRPNGKLIDLVLAADALRRAGARRLILVAPYFCYLRQDAVFGPGEPLSRDVVGPLIGARFDAVATVQAHLHRTADLSAVLGTRTVNVWAVETLAAVLPAYVTPPLIIGPDAESAPWAAAWARRLGGEAVSLSKTRRGDRAVDLAIPLAINAAERAVVIIDDIASSGDTLARAVELLRDAAAASIDVAVVHALMDAAATERLRAAGARRIVSTDSIAHPTNAAVLAPLLAEAVRELIGS